VGQPAGLEKDNRSTIHPGPLPGRKKKRKRKTYVRYLPCHPGGRGGLGHYDARKKKRRKKKKGRRRVVSSVSLALPRKRRHRGITIRKNPAGHPSRSTRSWSKEKKKKKKPHSLAKERETRRKGQSSRRVPRGSANGHAARGERVTGSTKRHVEKKKKHELLRLHDLAQHASTEQAILVRQARGEEKRKDEKRS